MAQAKADLLLDASPVNLRTGQPGLSCVRTAIGRGMGVVLANKAPLVLAFRELTEAAKAAGAGLAYSATVCGALPVVNIGRRDLVGCDIRGVRGIFNSTSNSILEAMSLGGTYAEALHQAQLDGIAEADPSLDVEGWDTANKLVIIANSILGMPATLADVQPVEGITGITAEQIVEGAARGQGGQARRDGREDRTTASACRSSRSGCQRTTFWRTCRAGRWASSSTPTSWACSSSRSTSAARCQPPPPCCAT